MGWEEWRRADKEDEAERIERENEEDITWARWRERDLSKISGFEAPHTWGQRWGRVCGAVKELAALMKEMTVVSALKKRTDYNYRNNLIIQGKKSAKTHTIYITVQTPQLYPFPHKSNFIIYTIILHMFAGNSSHQCLGSSAHVSFFLTQSSSFPAISPYCEAPHASNLPFKWVSLLSCVLQKHEASPTLRSLHINNCHVALSLYAARMSAVCINIHETRNIAPRALRNL